MSTQRAEARRDGPPWLDAGDGIPAAQVKYFAERPTGGEEDSTDWLDWYAAVTCPHCGELQLVWLRPHIAQHKYLNGPYLAACELARRPLPSMAEVKRFRVTLGYRPVPLRPCPAFHEAPQRPGRGPGRGPGGGRAG